MFNREPTVILGALFEVIRAVIPTLIIFGIISWTGEQVSQVMLLVGVIVGFFNVLLARSQVVPVTVAGRQIETAIRMPTHTTKEQVISAEEASR